MPVEKTNPVSFIRQDIQNNSFNSSGFIPDKIPGSIFGIFLISSDMLIALSLKFH
jgi:hypothetical protein